MTDITKYLTVSDMPEAVKAACIERGHSETDEITVSTAMAEWLGWEIGNPQLGRDAAEYVAEMTNKNSIL